jgi:hypothetical protein
MSSKHRTSVDRLDVVPSGAHGSKALLENSVALFDSARKSRAGAADQVRKNERTRSDGL